MDLLDGSIKNWFIEYGTEEIPPDSDAKATLCPNRLIISDQLKNMFELMFISMRFKSDMMNNPPSFPKREVPNDPFDCKCRYCSSNGVEVYVRYGDITNTMWTNALKRRAEKCQGHIRNLVISDDLRKLLEDLCNNHGSLSLQPAFLERQKRCSCEKCNPSDDDIATAIKAITTRKYGLGLPTCDERRRAKNLFNKDCPYGLGVHLPSDFTKPYVEFDENKTPHSPRSKNISIAIKDALLYDKAIASKPKGFNFR